MRRMILQKFITWCESLFPFVHQNGTTTEVGGNLEVDGQMTSAQNEYEAIINETFAPTITSGYTKGVLRNNHFEIIVNFLGVVTALTTSEVIASIIIPKNIADKLIPIAGENFVTGLIMFLGNEKISCFVDKANNSDDTYTLSIKAWEPSSNIGSQFVSIRLLLNL